MELFFTLGSPHFMFHQCPHFRFCLRKKKLPWGVLTLGFVHGKIFTSGCPHFRFISVEKKSFQDVPTLGFDQGFFFHLGMSPLWVLSMEKKFHHGMFCLWKFFFSLQDVPTLGFVHGKKIHLKMSPLEVLSVKFFFLRCPQVRCCLWIFFYLGMSPL